MKEAYIIALTDALLSSTDTETVLVNTKAVLEKKGHMRLWPSVLKGTMQALNKRLSDSQPEVLVAKPGTAGDAMLKAALEAVGAESASHKEVVDETIVGGFVLRFKDKLVDASYKRALLDMYRRVTK
jgi:F0F1-type ATP synthase delta subunit